MQGDNLRLTADNSNFVKWKCNVSYAVHQDMKSHTGTFMTLGKCTITSISKKQKLNTQSSTEAELVGLDDIMGDILWSQKFLQAQGYNIKHNILEQGNKGMIILQENGNKNQS